MSETKYLWGKDDSKSRYLLLVTRHLTRKDKESEDISLEDLELAKTLKGHVDDIKTDFRVDTIAFVSGYKTKGEHFGRTQNTARAFGYNLFLARDTLVFTPKEGWRPIPFGEPFPAYVAKYDAKDPGTVELATVHADFYEHRIEHLADKYVPNENGVHLFTHDGRIEAACAKLVPKFAEKLGAPMDHGETLALIAKPQGSHLYTFQPLAVVRRTGIQDIL